MSERAFETAQIADLEGTDGWSPIRQRLGVQAFGINAWTVHEVDASIIGEHDEQPSGHEELYLVTAGSATFTVDGEQVDAPAGTIVFVRDPNATRAASARQADTTVLVVGGKPGEAFRPRAWETNAEVIPLFEQGAYVEAKLLLIGALDRYEERGTLLYNLACAEAQLGEAEAALEHLRDAVLERPSLAGNARDDRDLAPLRDDPRFAALVPPA